MMQNNQAFWYHLSDEMYPTWFLHTYVMNGKISGHVAALGEMQGDILCVLDAPVGCGFHYRHAARRRRRPYFELLCSDLKEQEIIMGGEAKLEQTVRDAYARYKPKLIFIIPSPITDILNEDIFSVAERLRAEGIPAVAAGSERFSLPDKAYVRNLICERGKLKVKGDNHLEIDVSGCGFNEAMCAVIDHIMKKQPIKKHSVNIETISWGIEGGRVINEIEEFLGRCGITVNCRIPNSSLEEILSAPSAELNLVSHFIKWARRMKCHFGTDYLHMGESQRYVGLEGIARFYRDIGEKLNMTDTMEPLIEAEYEKALKETASERKYLASRRCVLVCGSLTEVPNQLNLYAKQLGIEIIGVCVFWTDDSKRYYYIDDKLEEQFCERMKEAVELYSPGARTVVNPDEEEFLELINGCDAIIGSNNFTLDGKGVPVIPAYFTTLSFTFDSYVRCVKRVSDAMKRTKEKKSLILQRMGIENDDINMFPHYSHKASREMWMSLWWDYSNDTGKGCSH